jgi:hypothetical protein
VAVGSAWRAAQPDLIAAFQHGGLAVAGRLSPARPSGEFLLLSVRVSVTGLAGWLAYGRSAPEYRSEYLPGRRILSAGLASAA